MDLGRLQTGSLSAQRARERWQRLGVNMNGKPLWTDAERELVRRHAPNYDLLCSLLPHRTREAVRQEAARVGVANVRHRYTGVQIARLRGLYKQATWDELLTAFPFATRNQLYNMARIYGFHRPRRQYKTTNVPALDAIRQKCFEIRWTMADLDEAAGTKKYFARNAWRKGSVNYHALWKAAKALGGRIVIEWDED